LFAAVTSLDVDYNTLVRMVMSTPRPASASGPKPGSSKSLNDYVRFSSVVTFLLPFERLFLMIQQLGDSLGKGAFGQVYRTSSQRDRTED